MFTNKSPGVFRAAMVISALIVLMQVLAVLLDRILGDWRTYLALAVASVIANMLVRNHHSADRHRPGSIERVPYDITGGWDRRKER